MSPGGHVFRFEHSLTQPFTAFNLPVQSPSGGFNLCALDHFSLLIAIQQSPTLIGSDDFSSGAISSPASDLTHVAAHWLNCVAVSILTNGKIFSFLTKKPSQSGKLSSKSQLPGDSRM